MHDDMTRSSHLPKFIATSERNITVLSLLLALLAPARAKSQLTARIDSGKVTPSQQAQREKDDEFGRLFLEESYDVFLTEHSLPVGVAAKVYFDPTGGTRHTIVMWKGHKRGELLDHARQSGVLFRWRGPAQAGETLTIDANGVTRTPGGAEVSRMGHGARGRGKTAKNVAAALKRATITERAGIGAGTLIPAAVAFKR